MVRRTVPRESLNLRVPSDLKRKLEEYAEATGLTLNAAAIVLLTEALHRPRRSGKTSER